MSETRVRVRANKSTGELEIEGPASLVSEWWDRVWPDLESPPRNAVVAHETGGITTTSAANGQIPELFGEYFNQFRSEVADVDKMLIAGVFAQSKEPDRIFSTKLANQLLIDQNVKVTNASECVRRLAQSKKVFVVSEGKFRVSVSGFEHLKTLQ